jgi:hypothetical protein
MEEQGLASNTWADAGLGEDLSLPIKIVANNVNGRQHENTIWERLELEERMA